MFSLYFPANRNEGKLRDPTGASPECASQSFRRNFADTIHAPTATLHTIKNEKSEIAINHPFKTVKGASTKFSLGAPKV